ncbi:unnamed protein product [Notodromas monacha]|uniref:Ammonium transporter AmtB-like domain-containing protein n=1 Tax=Notodromas monacha TaxID=399045 RepID=A0A7R9BRV7_9CRUS|nr:unnamed protein product [Notodromas monacha]CAG0919473.1 unnamed protein product [Notodromas monacha]
MTKSVGLGLSPVASWLFISFQVVLIVLYGLFTRHVGTVTVDHSKSSSSDVDASTAGHSKGEEIFNVGPYAAFQDVHVMIFIGFGFLMTFLSRYSYSAVGFNFLLAALAVEWSILCQGFLHAWHSQHAYITLKLSNLLAADIASAAFLISFGVILGRLTPLQLMVMVVIQMPLFAINEHLTYFVFKDQNAERLRSLVSDAA